MTMNAYEIHPNAESMKVIRQMKTAAARRGLLTPQLAKLLLATMGHNRPIRTRRVEGYRKSMREGTWIYSGQGIVLSESGRMLNGQHTCSAVVQEGVPVEALFILDVSDLAWNRMDRGAERSASDMLEVKNRAVAAAVLRLVQAELVGSLNATNMIILDASAAPALMARCPRLTDSVDWAVSIRKKIAMSGALLGYGHWRTSQHDPAMAAQFWARLSDGEGLTKANPVYLLRERLLSNASTKAKLPTNEVLALLIKSWTAFATDTPMKTLRWTQAYEKFPSWPETILLEDE
jgi:hypothetical protein